METTNRFVYDEEGNIVLQIVQNGEIEPLKLSVCDVSTSEVDFTKFRVVKIDAETKQPIIEEITQ